MWLPEMDVANLTDGESIKPYGNALITDMNMADLWLGRFVCGRIASGYPQTVHRYSQSSPPALVDESQPKERPKPDYPTPRRTIIDISWMLDICGVTRYGWCMNDGSTLWHNPNIL
jgi:hypothetical protein